MQPHTKHSHTSPVLHLRSHTFVSLLRSRKAVGVRKKSGFLFAWMVLAVLLVGSLPADALQLAKVEAEQATVGTWGAVVNDTTASGGKAVRWNDTRHHGPRQLHHQRARRLRNRLHQGGIQQRLPGVRAPDGRQRRVGNPTFVRRRHPEDLRRQDVRGQLGRRKATPWR